MKIQRNSNLELLRIVSMLFIIMGHFVDQSGYMRYDMNLNNCLVAILSCAARIATNIFLIIGVWFMSFMEFRAEKVIKLYIQLYFYSFGLTIIMLLLGVDVAVKDLFRGILPFCGRALWFASAYITLYLLTPVLNKFFSLDLKLQRTFVILSFVFVCGVSTIPDAQNGYLIDSIWFVFVYIWIGYYRRNIYKMHNTRKKEFMLIGLMIYLLMVITYFACMCKKNESELFLNATVIGNQYLMDIKTLPNFTSAFLIFLGVLTSKENQVEIINFISSYSFSVYLFHQVPAFYMWLWDFVYRAQTMKDSCISFAYVLFVGTSVYGLAMMVETFRQKLIEPRVIKIKAYGLAIKKIDHIFRS